MFAFEPINEPKSISRKILIAEKYLNFHTVPFHPPHCCHLCRRRQLNSRKIEITGISLNVQNKRCIKWQIGNLLKIEKKMLNDLISQKVLQKKGLFLFFGSISVLC